MKKILLIWLCCLLAITCQAQQLTNARFQVQSNQIEVLYDLLNVPQGQTFEVSLLYSTDGGKTWQTPRSTSGDIGSQQSGGSNKRIVWQVQKDLPEGLHNSLGFKVKATATRKAYEPEMVLIGGTFEMGSNDGEEDEKPIHTVTLDDFYMGKYEVTLAQFKAFIDDSGYKTDAEKRTDDYGSRLHNDSSTTDFWKKTDGINWRHDAKGKLQTDYRYPVVHVSWNDAMEYCKWLSRKTGKSYTLPTTVQWEYVSTIPASQFGVNYFRLYDMIEWCSNEGSHGKSLRGESSREIPICSRYGYLSAESTFRRYNIGFRVSFAPQFYTSLMPVNQPTSTIWAVVVGIETYKYSKDGCITDLAHAKDDAYEFANYLQYNLGVPSNQIAKLLDNKASKSSILTNLETQFSQAGSNDLVVFYYSGHGEERKFIPNDYKCQDDGTGLPTIKYKDIETAFNKSKAKHKLLIADACRIEETNYKSPALLRRQQAQFYDELNKAQAGIAVLMSASKGEKSTEGGENGLFTYYLLEGLKGSADSNKNGIVTVSEIAKYVKAEVIRASDDEQHPEINTGNYDPNMPIGVVGQ